MGDYTIKIVCIIYNIQVKLNFNLKLLKCLKGLKTSENTSESEYMYVKVENICKYYRPEVYFSLKINIFQKQLIGSFKVKKTSQYNTRMHV